jgi:hypothetical protein
MVGGKTVTTSPNAAFIPSIDMDPLKAFVGGERLLSGVSSNAMNATIFESSIGDTVSTGDGENVPAATTGIGLTPIVIVGGLLLLLFMMSKGRF